MLVEVRRSPAGSARRHRTHLDRVSWDPRGSERRILDGDDHVASGYLWHRNHLCDGLDRGGRNPSRTEKREPLFGVACSQDPIQIRLKVIRSRRTSSVCGILGTVREIRAPKCSAKSGKEVVVSRADHNPAVRALESLERNDRWVTRSMRSRDDTCPGACRDSRFQERDLGVEHRNIDQATFVCSSAFVDRADDAKRQVETCDEISNGDADPHRLSTLESIQTHHTAERLCDDVIGGFGRKRASHPESRECPIDQPWPAFVHNGPPISESFHDAGGEILDEDIGIVEKTLEDCAISLAFEIQCDRLLVAVDAREVKALITEMRAECARIVAGSGSLHLDHSRAKGREDRSGEGGRKHSPKIDDLDSGQSRRLIGRSRRGRHSQRLHAMNLALGLSVALEIRLRAFVESYKLKACGGIGRRSGLKIRRAHPHPGSSPGRPTLGRKSPAFAQRGSSGGRLQTMVSFLERLPRRGKKAVALGVDVTILASAMWASIALRLGGWWPDLGDRSIVVLCLVAGAIGIPCCFGFGLYREITRYVGLQFAVRVGYAVTAMALLLGCIALMDNRAQGLPRSSILIFWMAAMLGIGTSRALARYLIGRMSRRASSRTLIYGAGDVGAGLVAMLSQDQRSNIVGFIDDDDARVGSEIRSLRVHSASDIRDVVRTLRVDTVLLALPESSRRRRREIFQELTAIGLRVMLVPTLKEIAEGTARIDSVRQLQIADLLGRPAVEPIGELLCRNISGANVLVTGAGGSIGSEIARQALRLGPRRLVVLDNSEFNLYAIENELRGIAGSSSGVHITAVLGSVLDRVRLERVMTDHLIGTVYHAAAYKHVPIVEANEIEGVSVNAIGTLRAAQAATRAGVESFVLISTDKAVRPSSVMGASKRLAEICLQALADTQRPQRATVPNRRDFERSTRFTIVRFGNVLGSSGSVVPLFTEQIRSGGPVTVTDPQMERYFMTIPEASSLVIQAGAMGRGGEVFVLDMGEPIRIIDLARNMIRLAGYSEKSATQPLGDIAIQVTGLRPGEKLSEELLIGDRCGPTEHGAILQAHEPFIPWEELEPQLDCLEAALDQHDVATVRALLRRLVSGYENEEKANALVREPSDQPRPTE